MKRSSLALYLGVWLSSIALAYFIGGARASQDSNDEQVPSNALTASQLQEQATRNDPARLDMPEASLDLDNIEAFTTPSREAMIGLLNDAFALPISDPQRFTKINDLLKRYATVDPLAALEMADAIPSLRDAGRARNDILEVWASHEPMAALAWADVALANVPSNLRNSQMLAIIRGFAETNPKGAFSYANALSEDTPAELREKNRLLSEVIETQIRSGGLAEAQTTIALMPDGPSKENLQRELVNEWAAFAPTSAAAYVQALGADASTSMKTALIDQWAENDPAAAAAWLSHLSTEDPAYARATAKITREWTRYDLTASSEWLNSLDASPELDRAVATYTYRAAQEDPSTAMTWAESITSKNMRERMVQQVAATWKNEDPEGFTAYLDNSDLSESERKKLESAQAWGGRGGWGRGSR